MSKPGITEYLGYYTWVEQQGVEFEDFEARRQQAFCIRSRSSGTR